MILANLNDLRYFRKFKRNLKIGKFFEKNIQNYIQGGSFKMKKRAIHHKVLIVVTSDNEEFIELTENKELEIICNKKNETLKMSFI